MTHIKRFFESTKYHSRLSVEEIEDYFLEFIEAGDIHLYHSGIPIGQNYVAVYFTLDRKFRSISDYDSMMRLTQILTHIANICKRWNLDYNFELNGLGNKPGGGGQMQTQLEIRQTVPQVILDQFPDITTPNFSIDFESRNYRFNMYLKHDDKTMDFYIILDPRITYGIGGNVIGGIWRKDDWKYFNDNESAIIDKLVEEYSKLIPCQYSHKVKADDDIRYGQYRKFKYNLKLLV